MPENINEELAVPVQQEVAVNDTLQTMGIIVAASPNGEGDLAAIRQAFDGIGLVHLAPDMRTLKEALRVALVQAFSKKNRRVAPCGKGYEVVEEVQIPGTMRNEHRHILSVHIENNQIVTDVETFVFDGGAYTVANLQQWVSDARQKIDGTILGESIAAVCFALNGISIRDAGGAYWLPSTAVDKFNALKTALDTAGRPVRLAVMDMANTPRSIESTIVRIEAMVDGVCAELDNAVHNDEIGVKALSTQADRATKLIAQIAEYEQVLATALPTLQQKVQSAKRDVIQAGLDAHARKERKLVEKRVAADQAEAEAQAAEAEDMV